MKKSFYFCLLLLVSCLLLLTACVSGDDYTNTMAFLRRWNASPEAKELAELKINGNTLWHEDGYYAAWLYDEEYLLALSCEPETDDILACSLTESCDAQGDFTGENREKFYSLAAMMIRAMCGTDSAAAREILTQVGLDASGAVCYYEQAFFSYSLIADDLGVTFRIVNQRLVPKSVPELTLFRSQETAPD